MGFGSFGMGEMIFIFLIVLLLFGAKRLPEIGSSLGKGIREFKSSVKDIERELTVPPERTNQIHRTNAPPPPAVQPAAQPVQNDGEPRKLSSSVSTDERSSGAS
ncbi:MAG: twin-arginine translocase TatA/TatE family subunit [Gemmatimonadales bacterium]